MSSVQLWDDADQRVALNEAPGRAVRLPIQTRRRRGYSRAMADPRAQLHLVDDDGLRRWIYEPPAAESWGRRGGGGGLLSRAGDVLRSFSFTDVQQSDRGPNQVTDALLALDRKLTPDQGLRRWDPAQQRLVPAPSPALAGKTLLLVHGTFSNSDMYLTQWAATPQGQALWAGLQARYANILVFDHPTLAVPPWINALDLHQALRQVTGPIDVVAHSRGGLVVSWWLRVAPTRANQVVLVGSPLDGTSLASPYRLRQALDHLATVADLLAAGGEALSGIAPIAAGAAGLAKIFGRVLHLGASVPLVDAAVALVPGLASQQRTSNNAETRSLFAQQWLGSPRFALVSADFQPSTNAPLWQVWDRLKTAGAQIVAGAADGVFDGPNDLVVDTAAMGFLGALQPPQSIERVALGAGNTYHTSYFRDPRVTALLDQRLR